MDALTESIRSRLSAAGLSGPQLEECMAQPLLAEQWLEYANADSTIHSPAGFVVAMVRKGAEPGRSVPATVVDPTETSRKSVAVLALHFRRCCDFDTEDEWETYVRHECEDHGIETEADTIIYRAREARPEIGGETLAERAWTRERETHAHLGSRER